MLRRRWYFIVLGLMLVIGVFFLPNPLRAVQHPAGESTPQEQDRPPWNPLPQGFPLDHADTPTAVLTDSANRLPNVLPVWTGDAEVAGENSVEPAVAADPRDPLTFVAGAITNYGIGHFTTTDGGQTWGGGNFTNECCDPTVAYNRQGHVFMAMLHYPLGDSCSRSFTLSHSTDGGINWPAPQIILTPAPTDQVYDKPWLAIDTAPASPYFGRIYLTFNDAGNSACPAANGRYSNARVSWSSDEGQTWSSPVIVNDATHNEASITNAVVTGNGTLYLSYLYHACATNCKGNFYFNILQHSTDGGINWSAPITITAQAITYPGVTVNGYNNLLGSGSTFFRYIDQAILGVSPSNPQEVYAVWTDGRWESKFDYQFARGTHADIAFSRSSDGGATWSSPLRINDDPQGNGKDQFFPWLAVGSNGTLHVAWSDRRDTSDGYGYRPYYSQSTDGGRSWSANQPITTFESKPFDFMGDYNGLAVSSDNTLVLPIWADGRRGVRIFTNPGSFVKSAPTNTAGAAYSPTNSTTPGDMTTPTVAVTATPAP